jgi:hypothetical protein
MHKLLQHQVTPRVSVESGAIEQGLKIGEVAVQVTGDEHVFRGPVQLDHGATAARRVEKAVCSTSDRVQ